MKDVIIMFLRRLGKIYLNPSLIIKMILLYVLLTVHGYTDSTTGNRWQLFDPSNLLCVDTFVVIGCIVLMILVARDVIIGMNSILIDGDIDSDEDDEFSLAKLIIQELEQGKKQPEKVIIIEEYRDRNKPETNN